jgi:hypothetical protein
MEAVMSKEKFELVFLAGGAMLNVLTNRLRRGATTPREEVGAAAHEVGRLLDERHADLADAGPARRQVAAIRGELTADRPNPLVLAAHVDELAHSVTPVEELATAVDRLRVAVTGYVG